VPTDSHGLNRFYGFVKSMSPDADGVPININATPELVSSFGVMEQYLLRKVCMRCLYVELACR
jgi:hypothetical protein